MIVNPLLCYNLPHGADQSNTIDKQCRQRRGQCGGTGKTATDWLHQQLRNKMAHLQESRRRLQWNLQHRWPSFGQGMEQG